MKGDSISAIWQGIWGLIRGVFACWAGLTWAYAITTRQWPWQFSLAEWLLGWMSALGLPAFMTLGISGWWWLWMWMAWLLLPFALVMTRMALLKEWNLWIVAGVLATVAGGLGFCGLGIILDWQQWPVAVTLLSLAVAAVLFGTAQERGWFVWLWRLVFGGNRERVAQEEKCESGKQPY